MSVIRSILITTCTAALLATGGCAIMRGQESVGSYVDDASITTAVKTKMVEDKTVDAGAVKVETLNGVVQLSGFAKSAAERSRAESIARATNGVRHVQNNLSVRP